MKKHRLLAIVMAMMMVVAFGMTSMAAANTATKANVTGSIWTSSSTRVDAKTQSGRSDNRAYVSLTVEYMSSAGGTYVTSPVTKSGTGTVSVNKNLAGSYMSAWSSHGGVGKDFTLYI